MTMHSTRVKIVGEEYTIRSTVPPEQTEAVAAHVDAAIRKVLESPTITDELFREREAQGAVAEKMKTLSGELRRWLPPGKRGESLE